MATTHIIRAQPTVRFHIGTDPIGGDDIESADPVIEIEYSYLAGYPATGPSDYFGGDPGWGPEIELIRAKLIDGDGLDPDQKQVEEWAADWLDGSGYERACDLAEDERELVRPRAGRGR